MYNLTLFKFNKNTPKICCIKMYTLNIFKFIKNKTEICCIKMYNLDIFINNKNTDDHRRGDGTGEAKPLLAAAGGIFF